MIERVTLTKKEQQRLMVLNQVMVGELSMNQAGEVLDLSVRQVKRLVARCRKEGTQALAHGNKGRKPKHALDESTKKKVADLAGSKYTGVNTQHFTELLAEREEIVISRSSVRRILLDVGLTSPRKRRPPKHRSRRERWSQEGMLLQIDGSHHDWLKGRGPYLTLVGAIDDATGKVPYALFREQEDAQGYFLLLSHIVIKEGIPLALYHDRHGIFLRSPKDSEILEEQLTGDRAPTQFGRLLKELGIASIPASSPQAKGRIERLWGTFQDRLTSELRLAGAKTIEEANQVLWDFLPRYNSKFAVQPPQPGSAYRQPEQGFIPEEIFSFKYQRTVGQDNVVRFRDYRLQIEPSNERSSYARVRVEVHERMDGSIAVYYQGHCLVTKSAPPEAPVLRVSNIARVMPHKPSSEQSATPVVETKIPALSKEIRHTKPAQNHPWRRPFRTHIDRGRG